MKAFSVDAEWQNPTQMNHIITSTPFFSALLSSPFHTSFTSSPL